MFLLTETELVAWIDLGADATPLHVQLARQLQDLIVSGQLRVDQRLPAERKLAKLLHLSRNTVSSAYRSLATQGWIETRHGSGARVTAGPHSQNRTHQVSALFSGLAYGADSAATTDVVDMTLVSPAPWPGVAQCWDAVGSELVDWLGRTGYSRAGDPVFRERLATHLSDQGLATSAGQLLVTSGAQQGLNLIARLLLHAGDAVLTEPHTYPGALDAFRAAGATSHPLNSGGSSITTGTPRLLYTISANQNPTGMSSSPAQLERVAQVASDVDAYVLDDISLLDMRLSPPPKRPLAGGLADLVPPQRLLSVGSFSKLYWAGLRLGWIRADQELIGRLMNMKTTADLGAPLPSQALGCQLLDHHEEAMQWRSAQLVAAVDLTMEILTAQAPEWRLRRPEGGQYFWIELPSGSALELTRASANNGAIAVPGQLLHPYGHGDRHIRLSMVVPLKQLEVGVRRLAKTWREMPAEPNL